MKTSLKLFAFTMFMFAGFSATAQTLTDTAMKNYVAGLHSDNQGVVESCLMIVAKMKIDHPDWNMTSFEKEVKSMIVSKNKTANRYKLYLTSYILENPSAMKDVNFNDCSECDQFFLVAATKINQDLASL